MSNLKKINQKDMSDKPIMDELKKLVSPLIESMIEVWVKPKLQSFGEDWVNKKMLQDHFFENKFGTYLKLAFGKLSIINILSLRNQQKKLNDLYIPLTISVKSQGSKEENYVIEGFNKTLIDNYKRVLITDTAGMGKSTLLKKMFLSVVELNAGIPIFIELRRLGKEFDILDYIISGLELLNEDISRKFILKLVERGDFVFFLDGYDEIPSESLDLVTTGIQDFIGKAPKNRYILASRPDESLASFGDFKEFKINSLNQEEAFSLLSKYDNYGDVSQALINTLEQEYYENIDEFLVNPLLVSLLYTSYEYKHVIPFKKHVFYRQVFDALYESHDLSKEGYFIREKHSKLGIDDFHTILRYISFVCLKKDKIEYTKDEFLEIIRLANKECTFLDFNESSLLKDLILTVPLFIRDGNYYKWAHKSLFEYFVTQFIYLDSEQHKIGLLKSMSSKDKYSKYENVLDIYSEVDFKTFDKVVVFPVIQEFISYCEDSFRDIDVSESLLTERKELTFGRQFLLMQIPNYKDEVSGHQFMTNYMREKYFVKKGYEGARVFSLTIISNSQEKGHFNNFQFAFLNTSDVVKKRNVEKILLRRKSPLYRKVTSTPKTINLVKCNVEEGVLYRIDDQKSAFYNDPEFFHSFSELLKISTESYVLNYNTCNDYLEKERNESISEGDFMSL